MHHEDACDLMDDDGLTISGEGEAIHGCTEHMGTDITTHTISTTLPAQDRGCRARHDRYLSPLITKNSNVCGLDVLVYARVLHACSRHKPFYTDLQRREISQEVKLLRYYNGVGFRNGGYPANNSGPLQSDGGSLKLAPRA